ncbi:MAG: hypothetical protein RJA11_1382 [Bacteroidota bacterium]|jgi:hypothetical protein
MSPRLKLFVERSRDEKLLFTPFTSAPLGVHSAGLINCSSSEAETRIPGPPLGFARGATTINCSSSEAETRTYYSHPSPRLRSVSTRLRSGCNHHAPFVERSRGSISDLLSLIFRNLNSSKTYDTKNP